MDPTNEIWNNQYKDFDYRFNHPHQSVHWQNQRPVEGPQLFQRRSDLLSPNMAQPNRFDVWKRNNFEENKWKSANPVQRETVSYSDVQNFSSSTNSAIEVTTKIIEADKNGESNKVISPIKEIVVSPKVDIKKISPKKTELKTSTLTKPPLSETDLQSLLSSESTSASNSPKVDEMDMDKLENLRKSLVQEIGTLSEKPQKVNKTAIRSPIVSPPSSAYAAKPKSPRVIEKVVKESDNIFGSLLSSIDDQIIEKSKKNKDEKKETVKVVSKNNNETRRSISVSSDDSKKGKKKKEDKSKKESDTDLVKSLESKTKDGESKTKKSDTKTKESDSKSVDTKINKNSEPKIKNSDAKSKSSDSKSKNSDSKSKDSESKISESKNKKSDSKVLESASKTNESDSKSKKTDSKKSESKSSESESKKSESKCSESESKKSESKSSESESKNKKSESKSSESESKNKDSKNSKINSDKSKTSDSKSKGIDSKSNSDVTIKDKSKNIDTKSNSHSKTKHDSKIESSNKKIHEQKHKDKLKIINANIGTITKAAPEIEDISIDSSIEKSIEHSIEKNIQKSIQIITETRIEPKLHLSPNILDIVKSSIEKLKEINNPLNSESKTPDIQKNPTGRLSDKYPHKRKTSTETRSESRIDKSEPFTNPPNPKIQDPRLKKYLENPVVEKEIPFLENQYRNVDFPNRIDGTRPSLGPNRPLEGPNRAFDNLSRPFEGPNRHFDGPNRPFDGNMEGLNRFDGPIIPFDGRGTPFNGPKRPFDAPNIPFDGPNRHIDGPNRLIEGPNRHIDGPNRHIEGPNRHIDGPNRLIEGPNRHIDGPNRHIEGPNRHFDGPNRLIEGPNRHFDGPNRLIEGPNRHFDGPNRHIEGPNFDGPNRHIEGPNRFLDGQNRLIEGPNIPLDGPIRPLQSRFEGPINQFQNSNPFECPRSPFDAPQNMPNQQYPKVLYRKDNFQEPRPLMEQIPFTKQFPRNADMLPEFHGRNFHDGRPNHEQFRSPVDSFSGGRTPSDPFNSPKETTLPTRNFDPRVNQRPDLRRFPNMPIQSQYDITKMSPIDYFDDNNTLEFGKSPRSHDSEFGKSPRPLFDYPNQEEFSKRPESSKYHSEMEPPGNFRGRWQNRGISRGRGTSFRGAHDPRTHDRGAHDPRTHDRGGHDPRTHDRGGHDRGGHDRGGHDPRTHIRGVHDPRTHDRGAHDPRSHDRGAHDPRTHDRGEHDPRTHDRGAHDSRTEYRGYRQNYQRNDFEKIEDSAVKSEDVQDENQKTNEDILSPLSSLYGSEPKKQIGKGYGLQKFKIPKKKKPLEDIKKVEEKVELETEEEVKDQETDDESQEEIKEPVPIEEPETSTEIKSELKSEIKSPESENVSQNDMVNKFIQSIIEQGDTSMFYNVLEKLGESLPKLKYKRIRRIIESDSEDDEVIPEEKTPKEEDQPKSEDSPQKSDTQSETEPPENDEITQTVGERIKSRRRAKLEQKEVCEQIHKPKPKRRNALEMLQDDIREMFISEGVLTASGHRMCRILKEQEESFKKVIDTPNKKIGDVDDEDVPLTRRKTKPKKKTDVDENEESEGQEKVKQNKRKLKKDEQKIETDEESELDKQEKPKSVKRKLRKQEQEMETDGDELLEEPIKQVKSKLTKKKLKKNQQKIESESEDEPLEDLVKEIKTNKRNLKKDIQKIIETDDDSLVELVKPVKTKPGPKSKQKKLEQETEIEQKNDEVIEMPKPKTIKPAPKRKQKKNQKETDTETEEETKIVEKIRTRSSPRVVLEKTDISKYKTNLTDESQITSDSEIEVNPIRRSIRLISDESPKVAKPTEEEIDKENPEEIFDKPTNVQDESDNVSVTSSNKSEITGTGSKTKKIGKKKKRSSWSKGVIKKNPKKKIDITNVPEKSIEEPSVEKEGNQQIDLTPDINYFFDNRNKYNCKLCDYKGKFIVHHYRSVHPESENMISRLSPETSKLAITESRERKFETVIPYNEDFKVKKDRPIFCCRFCSTNFKHDFTSNFFDHITCHTGEYRYVCEYCTFRTGLRKALCTHYANLHANSKRPAVMNPVTPPQPNFRIVFGYLCEKCHYVQLNKYNVEKHISISHPDMQVEVIKINMSSKPVKLPGEENIETDDSVNNSQSETVENSSETIKTESIDIEIDKPKVPDLKVFLTSENIDNEEKRIEEERLKKMQEVCDKIKNTRPTLSFVDKLREKIEEKTSEPVPEIPEIITETVLTEKEPEIKDNMLITEVKTIVENVVAKEPENWFAIESTCSLAEVQEKDGPSEDIPSDPEEAFDVNQIDTLSSDGKQKTVYNIIQKLAAKLQNPVDLPQIPDIPVSPNKEIEPKTTEPVFNNASPKKIPAYPLIVNIGSVQATVHSRTSIRYTCLVDNCNFFSDGKIKFTTHCSNAHPFHTNTCNICKDRIMDLQGLSCHLMDVHCNSSVVNQYIEARLEIENKIVDKSVFDPPVVKSKPEEQKPLLKVRRLSGDLLSATKVDKPEETVFKPEQTVVKPAQTVVKPAQTIVKPAQTVVKPAQTIVKPAQPILKPAQTIVRPEQTVFKPAQTVLKPAETVVQPAANDFGFNIQISNVKSLTAEEEQQLFLSKNSPVISPVTPNKKMLKITSSLSANVKSISFDEEQLVPNQKKPVSQVTSKNSKVVGIQSLAEDEQLLSNKNSTNILIPSTNIVQKPSIQNLKSINMEEEKLTETDTRLVSTKKTNQIGTVSSTTIDSEKSDDLNKNLSNQTTGTNVKSGRYSPPRYIIVKGVMTRKKPEIFIKMIHPLKLRHLYKCPSGDCDYSTNIKFNMLQHIVIHKQATILYCPYCLLVVKYNEYVPHVEEKHAHCLYQCSDCFYRGMHPAYIKKHAMQLHPTIEVEIIQLEPHPEFKEKQIDQPMNLKRVVLPYKCNQVRSLFPERYIIVNKALKLIGLPFISQVTTSPTNQNTSLFPNAPE